MGYSTLNLSRGIEEGGTLMSPLIPWNVGGVFVISGLGLAHGNIENLLYIPLVLPAGWHRLLEFSMLLLGYSRQSNRRKKRTLGIFW